MSKKEELLRQFLDCSTRLNGHLSNLKSIPSQNFSSLDQKRMATLQNGIDALKILAQKLNNYSEGESTDVAAEKVAVEKAIETAEELEGDQTGKSQVGEPGEVDEMVKKIFEAEDLTGQSDFKPVSGVTKDAKERNDWTPEVNSIEDMNEAFSNYIANDYYRRATGREDFAFHFGKKSYSSNPKDYLSKLEKTHPDISGGLKVGSKGALIGMALDIALSSLKRNLSYDEYVNQCKTEGIEPIEKSKYTLGTLEDLKKSMVRGGSIGAISNIALKGGKGAMEGFKTSLANANFALTPQDFADASQMAEEKSMDIMKQSFSLSRGYYPGDNNATFLEWLQNNAEEYFSLRTDIYNQIINEAANFSTIGDAVQGGVIGGTIGGLTATAIAAIKQNKNYDVYKAEAERKGEKPLSRVAYLAKSKEVQSAGLKGLGGGATLGALINVARKSGKTSKKIKDSETEPVSKIDALRESKNVEDALKFKDSKLKDDSEYDKQQNIINSLSSKNAKKLAQNKKNAMNMESYQYGGKYTSQYNTKVNNQKGQDVRTSKRNLLAPIMSEINKNGVNSKVINSITDSTKKDKLKSIQDRIKKLDVTQKGGKKEYNNLISQAKNILGTAKLEELRQSFFSKYGYYPKHSYDMLFQNFCCQLVREGKLEFKDIASINFNFPQYQKDFAINKATVATTIGSGIAGGIGGKILADRKIKEEEKRLGRPLTQEERSKITKKYVIGGAVTTGTTGAVLSHGIQHAAGKGNATAQNIVNKVAGARDKVQSAYGQGAQKVGELKHKGERLFKKYVHGLDYNTQDAMENAEKYNQELTKQALGKEPSQLTSAETIALNRYYDQRKEGGLARKAMIVGGAGMAYKFLAPMVQQAVSRGAKVDEAQLNAMVQKMQAEGKSEEEIREAVQGYLQAAFFSYAQGFHKYY